ncbi:uncharacterized protein LOC143693664 [Agelaius phoeniceus]|uniref:uncharacterized protein LOC143693664 n=1 Tax=Agelaius phoeniceus TaxID=39638 RepID=UPI004054DA14
MAGGGGGGRRCRRRRRGPSAAVRPPPPPPLRPSAAQRRAGADCGNPEVVVAITGRVLHNALGGSNSATGAGGRAARPAPAQRRGLDTPPPPGPALRAPPRARGRRVRPPQAAAGALPSPLSGGAAAPRSARAAPRGRAAARPSLRRPPRRAPPPLPGGSPRGRRPSELTRPPAAAAAPPPTNQRHAAPRRAPIGPGGKRGSDRRAGGRGGGSAPRPRPCPCSRPSPSLFPSLSPSLPPSSAGALSCAARCPPPVPPSAEPGVRSLAFKSTAIPPRSPAGPRRPGSGELAVPLPPLPAGRAAPSPERALAGTAAPTLSHLPPGQRGGRRRAPGTAVPTELLGERGSDGGVPLVNPLGQTGRCSAAAGPPGAVGSGSAPTATSQTSGKHVSIPPSRPFSARTGFLSRREKSRPLRF